MEYSFDINLAKKYGVNESIMIKNFQYWIKKNKTNKNNHHEGRTWTFNSAVAFQELFPFWSIGQINRILRSLIRQEVLMSGNFSKVAYDRTKWYAFVDEQTFVEIEKCNSQKRKKDLSKLEDPITEINKPITYSKTTNKKTNQLYTDMLTIYDSFCKDMFDAPAKINGVEGKALKQMISYLKTLCKAKGDDSDDAVKNALKYIFANWHKIDPFLQKQIKLAQINSNITNIINQLKNGKEQRSSNSIADEILAKYK